MTYGAFPNNKSIMKLMYLIMHNSSKKRVILILKWGAVINQLFLKFQ